jgi:hypothetical protein
MATTIEEDSLRAEAEQTWRESPTLRAEFGGDFSRYWAYVRNDARGLVGPRSSTLRQRSATDGR